MLRKDWQHLSLSVMQIFISFFYVFFFFFLGWGGRRGHWKAKHLLLLLQTGDEADRRLPAARTNPLGLLHCVTDTCFYHQRISGPQGFRFVFKALQDNAGEAGRAR